MVVYSLVGYKRMKEDMYIVSIKLKIYKFYESNFID